MNKKNLLIIVAITSISWIVVNISHEILGHAFFGIISGLKLKAVNTTTAYLDVNWDNEIALNGFSGLRLTLIGGILMNFITGLIAGLVLKYKKDQNSNMRLFLWLFASFSYVIIIMNLVTTPKMGGGDIAGIIRTYDNQETAGTIILIIGLVIMILGYIFLQKSYLPKIKGHRSVLHSLTIIPVLTVIVIQTLSLIMSPFAYLPPTQNHLLASVFLYFHFFLWVLIVNILPSSSRLNSIKNILPEYSKLWIIIALAVSFFYILILGPGIGSYEGHPGL